MFRPPTDRLRTWLAGSGELARGDAGTDGDDPIMSFDDDWAGFSAVRAWRSDDEPIVRAARIAVFDHEDVDPAGVSASSGCATAVADCDSVRATAMETASRVAVQAVTRPVRVQLFDHEAESAQERETAPRKAAVHGDWRSHPHRQPLRWARSGRPGTVAARPAICISPVRHPRGPQTASASDV